MKTKPLKTKPSRRLNRRLPVQFRPFGELQSHVGYTSNLSETGMFVATIRPLKPGTQVDIEVGDKKRAQHLDAVVVHARKMPPGYQRVHPSGMGLFLLHPAESSGILRQLMSISIPRTFGFGRASPSWPERYSSRRTDAGCIREARRAGR